MGITAKRSVSGIHALGIRDDGPEPRRCRTIGLWFRPGVLEGVREESTLDCNPLLTVENGSKLQYVPANKVLHVRSIHAALLEILPARKML